MVAATSLFPLEPRRAEDEQRILLSNVTWEAYVTLRDSIESAAVFEAGAFRILTLRGDHYEAIDTSEVLPEPDLSRIAHFAEQADQHAALRAFRDELRRSP